jgi:hypothetical protein
MSFEVSEAELMTFLIAIEEGTIVLHPEREPQYVYAGNVLYKANNGWSIIVFNDANEWDYIDYIQTVDGRTLEFGDIEQMPTASQYSPNDDAAWNRYGIPGYCIFRCTACGDRLSSGPRYDEPLLCSSCHC